MTSDDILRFLFGAYRLARGDPRGMSFFDRTPEGALRSFAAALVVLPIFVIVDAIQTAPLFGQTPWWALLGVGALAYAIRWTAYPVAMIQIVRLIDREARYPDFLAAYNWSAALVYPVYLPVVLISAAGWLPVEAIGLMGLAVTIAALVYQWYVTKVALSVGGGMAAGLVAVDFALSLLIVNTTLDMLQPVSPALPGG